MKRALLVLAVAVGMLVLTPQRSWACSCAQADPAAQARAADTVIAGTLRWTSTNGLDRSYQVDVDAVYKGAAATTEKILTPANEASCGLGALATDRRYLFFVDGRHPGELRVNLCSGSQPYDASVARAVQQVTGAPKPPSAEPATRPVIALHDDRTLPTIAGVVGGGLVALGVVIGIAGLVRRRRAPS